MHNCNASNQLFICDLFPCSLIFSILLVRRLYQSFKLQHESEMKKVVLKLEINDDKEKKKAMKAVSSLSGIESITIEMKDRKLTVIGDVDPIALVNKLKKLCHTELLTVGPSKEPEKKKDEKKEDGKKDDDKKDDEKKKEQQIQELMKAYQSYNPYVMRQYVHHSAEEYPDSCVIC